MNRITAEQCETLAREAAEAGDLGMCEAARVAAAYLVRSEAGTHTDESSPDGDAEQCIRECQRAIDHARAQAD